MRARNREINIFNMSLLDILTGMLGAFLFLMLGMLPYYAKVTRNKDISPVEFKRLQDENQSLRDQTALQQQQIGDLKKQLDDLQKIVKQSGGGPMTADQIQQLMDQLNQMRQQIAQLQQQLQAAQNNAQQLQSGNGQLQSQVAQMQQQLDETTKDRDFWKDQQGTVGIITAWDSDATDIDVLVMDPKGKIYSPKVNDTVLGKKASYAGNDSHGSNYKYNQEGLLAFLEVRGDYLVFYRVPQNAQPGTYENLHGSYLYTECYGKEKGTTIYENSLGFSRAASAKPGGLYAWAILTYDPDKRSVFMTPATGAKLPDGIVLPPATPLPPPPPAATPTAPPLPFHSPASPLSSPPRFPLASPVASPGITPHGHP